MTITKPSTIKATISARLLTLSDSPTRVLTHCFMRLANINGRVFKRLSRDEAALCRQTVLPHFALCNAWRDNRLVPCGGHKSGTPPYKVSNPATCPYASFRKDTKRGRIRLGSTS